jgi:hypothetical protein
MVIDKLENRLKWLDQMWVRCIHTFFYKTNENFFTTISLSILVLFRCAPPKEQEKLTPRPNIIFIMAGDLGYMEVWVLTDKPK